MCFVAFHRQGNTRWLLSNRDEYIQRPAALAPEVQTVGRYSLLYPTDAKAGGAWITVRNDGVAAILLNGAEEPHISRPPYRQSRGLIIPEIMQAEQPQKRIDSFSFENIEPFTLLISGNEELTVFRWDGRMLKASSPDEKTSPCWSSATLYNSEMVRQREAYWQSWLQNKVITGADDFLTFASSKAPGRADTSIFMNREGGLQTISSTLICLTPQKAEMYYHDHHLGNRYFHPLNLIVPEKI